MRPSILPATSATRSATKSVGLLLGAIAITVAGGTCSFAATLTSPASFTFTSDDCSGGCGPNAGSNNNNFGTVTATVDATNTNLLDFKVTLNNAIHFLGGNGSGIATSFAFSLLGNPLSTFTFSNIVPSGTPTNFTQVSNSFSTLMMDGSGTFNLGLTCTTCGPGGSNPDGQSLSFSISSTGVTGQDLLNALAAPNGTSFFAADVISESSAGGNGNTGVIDATLGTPTSTPLPGAVWLFGTVLAGGFGFSRWRNRRPGPVSAMT